VCPNKCRRLGKAFTFCYGEVVSDFMPTCVEGWLRACVVAQVPLFLLEPQVRVPAGSPDIRWKKNAVISSSGCSSHEWFVYNMCGHFS